MGSSWDFHGILRSFIYPYGILWDLMGIIHDDFNDCFNYFPATAWRLPEGAADWWWYTVKCKSPFNSICFAVYPGLWLGMTMYHVNHIRCFITNLRHWCLEMSVFLYQCVSQGLSRTRHPGGLYVQVFHINDLPWPKFFCGHIVPHWPETLHRFLASLQRRKPISWSHEVSFKNIRRLQAISKNIQMSVFNLIQLLPGRSSITAGEGHWLRVSQQHLLAFSRRKSWISEAETGKKTAEG